MIHPGEDFAPSYTRSIIQESESGRVAYFLLLPPPLTLLKANPAAQVVVSLGRVSQMQLVACSFRTMRSGSVKKALHT